mmetsp:Transcript_38976/g.42223  ORF Transcript_38976/g.42223 Transcript_38976/m.42223 type:complete len:228 (-) Transcript_38976:82-765(-)
MKIVLKTYFFRNPATFILWFCFNTLVSTTFGAKHSKKKKSSSSRSFVEYLFVQTGQNCGLQRERLFPSSSSSPSEWNYRLILNKVSDTTFFSERPNRKAGVVSTQSFVEDFDNWFRTSVPNAAVTFVSKDGDVGNLTGPLIVEFSIPSNFDGGTSISYNLKQSFDQAKVLSLNSFFYEESTEVDKTMTVFFENCSMFIDSLCVCGCFPGSVLSVCLWKIIIILYQVH